MRHRNENSNNFIYRRSFCNKGTGFPPIYVNVNMKTGDTFNNWIDSLQAAWSAVQVIQQFIFVSLEVSCQDGVVSIGGRLLL